MAYKYEIFEAVSLTLSCISIVYIYMCAISKDMDINKEKEL